jgi:hypothetical protein
MANKTARPITKLFRYVCFICLCLKTFNVSSFLRLFSFQVDKCERYNEKVCYTTQQETCTDVSDQNCNAIVSSYQVRQCFNVTELKCRLQETITYETVQAVFTVQKCHTVTGLLLGILGILLLYF